MPSIPYPSTAAEESTAARQGALPPKEVAPSPKSTALPTQESTPEPEIIIKQDAGLDIIDDDIPSFAAAPTPQSAPQTEPTPVPEPEPELTPEQELEADVEEDNDEEPILFAETISELQQIILPEMTENLWIECMEQMRQKFPIKAMEIKYCSFYCDDEGLLTIGIHPENSFGRDALLDEAIIAAIKDFGQERCNKEIRLRIITDESLPSPEVEKIIIPPPAPKPAPKAEPKAPTDKNEENAINEEQELKQQEREDAFYNDPLIQLALEKFHARILKS